MFNMVYYVIMTIERLMTAINVTAKEAGLNSWIDVTDIIWIPMAMANLSSVLWVTQFPENKNTRLIRKQQHNLYFKGKLIFD
jgi:hypothetical protein